MNGKPTWQFGSSSNAFVYAALAFACSFNTTKVLPFCKYALTEIDIRNKLKSPASMKPIRVSKFFFKIKYRFTKCGINFDCLFTVIQSQLEFHKFCITGGSISIKFRIARVASNGLTVCSYGHWPLAFFKRFIALEFLGLSQLGIYIGQTFLVLVFFFNLLLFLYYLWIPVFNQRVVIIFDCILIIVQFCIRIANARKCPYFRNIIKNISYPPYVYGVCDSLCYYCELSFVLSANFNGLLASLNTALIISFFKVGRLKKENKLIEFALSK
jgi:hypothetical protein